MVASNATPQTAAGAAAVSALAGPTGAAPALVAARPVFVTTGASKPSTAAGSDFDESDLSPTTAPDSKGACESWRQDRGYVYPPGIVVFRADAESPAGVTPSLMDAFALVTPRGNLSDSDVERGPDLSDYNLQRFLAEEDAKAKQCAADPEKAQSYPGARKPGSHPAMPLIGHYPPATNKSAPIAACTASGRASPRDGIARGVDKAKESTMQVAKAPATASRANIKTQPSQAVADAAAPEPAPAAAPWPLPQENGAAGESPAYVAQVPRKLWSPSAFAAWMAADADDDAAFKSDTDSGDGGRGGRRGKGRSGRGVRGGGRAGTAVKPLKSMKRPRHAPGGRNGQKDGATPAGSRIGTAKRPQALAYTAAAAADSVAAEFPAQPSSPESSVGAAKAPSRRVRPSVATVKPQVAGNDSKAAMAWLREYLARRPNEKPTATACRSDLLRDTGIVVSVSWVTRRLRKMGRVRGMGRPWDLVRTPANAVSDNPLPASGSGFE